MEEMSREARELIKQARFLDEPPSASKARVASRLGLSFVGVGAVATATKSALAWGSGLSSALVMGGISAVSSFFVLSVVAPNPSPDVTSATVVAPTKMKIVPVAQAPVTATVGGEPERAVGPTEASTSAASPRKAVGPGAPMPPQDDSLAFEVQQARAANSAIEAGRPSAALALLNQEPKGYALEEERSALRIIALCGLGRRGEARAWLVAHEKNFPNSNMLTRIEHGCGRLE